MNATTKTATPTTAPIIGETYTTQRSGVVGVVVEIVRNPSGSLRVRLVTDTLETRWTTYVPDLERGC